MVLLLSRAMAEHRRLAAIEACAELNCGAGRNGVAAAAAASAVEAAEGVRSAQEFVLQRRLAEIT